MIEYKLVKCPKCRRYQITYAEKTFKCKFCGYSTKITKIRIWFKSIDPEEVRIILEKITFKLSKSNKTKQDLI